MRARAVTFSVATMPFLIALIAMALSPEAHAQSATVTRGAFGGVLSSDTTQGAARGALPQGATIGAARGSLPAGAVVGAIRAGSSTTTGVPTSSGTFFVPVAVGATPAGPSLPIFVGGGAFRGAVSPDAAGTLGAATPPGTVVGPPGSAEVAQRLQTEARMWLQDGNYPQGEAMLNRSVSVREEIAGGRNHPEVAQALEDNAKLLRQWNRDAAASDMEARAKEIRTALEPPPAPKAVKPPERF